MRRRLAVEVAAWSAFLFGLWCTFVGNLTSVELACGAAGAVIAAMALGQLRWLRWPAHLPKLAWGGWLPVVAVAALTETVRLVPAFVRCARGGAGRSRTVALGDGRDAPAANTHRAYAALALCATPGSYVIDTYPEHGEVLLHTLVEGTPDVTATVAP